MDAFTFVLVLAFLLWLPIIISSRFFDRWSPYRKFVSDMPVYLLLVIVLGLPAMLLSAYRDAGLYTENSQRLTTWEAQGCVAPQSIANGILIADGGSGHGTAFLLEGQLIVTNRHVSDIMGKQSRFVSYSMHENKDKASYAFTLLHVADAATRPDLAFYHMDETLPGVQPLKLATRAPQVGELLLVPGHNYKRDRFYPTIITMLGVHDGGEDANEDAFNIPTSWVTWFSEGIAIGFMNIVMPSALVDGGAMNSKSYVSHGDTAGGDSGSPVLNCAGEVVGVHFAGRSMYWFSGEQYGMSVTLEDLKAELEQLPQPAEPSSETVPVS